MAFMRRIIDMSAMHYDDCILAFTSGKSESKSAGKPWKLKLRRHHGKSC